MNKPNEVVSGITVDASGQATVDASMHDVLFDLALCLEERTDLPVDMQHVVAAFILASRSEPSALSTQITANNQELIDTLVPHVKAIFRLFGGELGTDE